MGLTSADIDRPLCSEGVVSLRSRPLQATVAALLLLFTLSPPAAAAAGAAAAAAGGLSVNKSRRAATVACRGRDLSDTTPSEQRGRSISADVKPIHVLPQQCVSNCLPPTVRPAHRA